MYMSFEILRNVLTLELKNFKSMRERSEVFYIEAFCTGNGPNEEVSMEVSLHLIIIKNV